MTPGEQVEKSLKPSKHHYARLSKDGDLEERRPNRPFDRCHRTFIFRISERGARYSQPPENPHSFKPQSANIVILRESLKSYCFVFSSADQKGPRKSCDFKYHDGQSDPDVVMFVTLVGTESFEKQFGISNPRNPPVDHGAILPRLQRIVAAASFTLASSSLSSCHRTLQCPKNQSLYYTITHSSR